MDFDKLLTYFRADIFHLLSEIIYVNIECKKYIDKLRLGYGSSDFNCLYPISAKESTVNAR